MPTIDKKYDLPNNWVSIAFSGAYSLPEFERIKNGLDGDQTSKWSITFDDPWITVWRGAVVTHALRVECTADKAIVVETVADLNYLSQLHDAADLDWHHAFLRDLIDQLCVLDSSGARKVRGSCWLNGHRIAVQHSSGFIDVALLSPAEARDFARRLLDLASQLEPADIPVS